MPPPLPPTGTTWARGPTDLVPAAGLGFGPLPPGLLVLVLPLVLVLVVALPALRIAIATAFGTAEIVKIEAVRIPMPEKAEERRRGAVLPPLMLPLPLGVSSTVTSLDRGSRRCPRPSH